MKRFGLIFIFFLLLVAPAFGQSTNQDFPSPVLREEVGGAIAARDIGDASLTRHFYTFYAGVGDLFLNVETANLNGDVDLFEAKTLRPISKISVYAADAATKTSRIVYFRQRMQVVMRVEGRTPNDDAASYKINFSGSFAAAADLPQPPEDLEPKTSGNASRDAVARVNSAGAIIEVIEPKKEAETTETESKKTEADAPTATPDEKAAVAATPRPAAGRNARTRPARRNTQPPQSEETAKTETAETSSEKPPAAAPRVTPTPRRSAAARRNTRTQPAAKEATAEPKVDPLASVRLVVLLKDGYKIERPMSEILRVSVDKGTLVVIAKNGKIERFALLDVLKFAIEQ